MDYFVLRQGSQPFEGLEVVIIILAVDEIDQACVEATNFHMHSK